VNNPTHNFREAKIILISYVTAGTGHRRAAEAIAEAVRKRLPHAQLECVDLLQDSPWWLQWAYPRIYKWFVRYIPSFWAIAYYVLDHPWVFRIVQPWRRRWNWLVARRFVRWVKSVQPDVVVATHFFPADVVAAAKQAGWLTSRLIVVLTDLFPHRLWLAPGAEAVVGGADQTKLICQARGIEPYIATGRDPHHKSWRALLAERPAPPPDDASPKIKMAYKLQTEVGQALYRLRKCTVEPVIGLLKEILGFRQFSLRGLAAAAGEWCLVCLAFNLKRLHVLLQA